MPTPPTGHHAAAVPAHWTPGSLPALHEEVWVIERGPVDEGPAEDRPRTGSMIGLLPDEKEVPLPLQHTDVKARVTGYIVTVDVTQQFHNPFDGKIEAVYLFPLPQTAAVSDFIMVIGERRIRGIVREREEARKIYAEAKRQGYAATLLTQERANVFTQRVANIEPKKRIDVRITYFQTLAYDEGWYEFTFPMVVGPRFNPPGSTEGVGAVGYGSPAASPQKNTVRYLRPGTRSGHDVSLEVDLDVGVPVEQVNCPTHVVTRKALGEGHTSVALSPLDAIPNKDFVLRYKVAGGQVRSTLMTQRDPRGGYFTMMLFPPEHLNAANRRPMEMVFVIDCSGSMKGWPLGKAKEAAARALRMLAPDDTFQVVRFSNSASQFAPAPAPATPANVARAIRYVDALEAGGGTMMVDGIRTALDFPRDPRRLRVVSFMTDGFIGNEKDVLSEVHHRAGPARIFSFGVGAAPNRYLLERLAKIGRGAVAYIGSASTPTDAVDRFYRRVSHPAMSDIRVDWGDARVSEVYPTEIPDLFVGRPVVLTGRFEGTFARPVRV
ncbi:MAG TPA: VIT domain-containing protein, partial [Planctomycetota bacterium]|nr:VIT domain-containing protein [Planctomycetota bacterium]